MATHSSEIIKRSEPQLILQIQREKTNYLFSEGQKVVLISGLGSEYSPILNNLQIHRKVLFTENESDWEIIKKWFIALNIPVPVNIVIWSNAYKHDQRKQLLLQLKQSIADIKGISLEDRDNLLYEQVTSDLKENGRPDWIDNNSFLRYRKWRRWEIENYLLNPVTIARLANVPEEDVRLFIQNSFGFAISNEFLNSDRQEATRVLFDIEGKTIITALEKQYGINKNSIAATMTADEVFDDARTLVNEIAAFSQL